MKEVSLVSLVIGWELSHRELTGAIVGARAPEEARELAQASTSRLSSEELRAFDDAISLWNE